MMLAQQTLDALPPTFWKNFCIAMFVILGLIATLIGIWGSIVLIRSVREKKDVAIANQPVEVRKSAKRYNHDLTEQRFGDHERRIAALEEQRNELIDKIDGIPDRVIATLKNTGAI